MTTQTRTLLWHGDGDECTGIHCGNPEHGWTAVPAPLNVLTGDALADFINREEARWRALKPNMSRERWLAARLTARAAATEDTK